MQGDVFFLAAAGNDNFDLVTIFQHLGDFFELLFEFDLDATDLRDPITFFQLGLISVTVGLD